MVPLFIMMAQKNFPTVQWFTKVKLGKSTTTVKLPDGSMIFHDGSIRYPNHKRINRRPNGKWMPPGQAKKIYGGSAKDYAPGQQKKWKNKDNGWRENGDKGSHQNNGKGKGHK